MLFVLIGIFQQSSNSLGRGIAVVPLLALIVALFLAALLAYFLMK